MVLFIVIIIIIFGFIYLRSLRTHPYTACKKCGGRGRFYHFLFPGAYGPCRKCGGNGREDRLGVRIFGGRREP
jgi:DnaJ-class molecular chaperone